MAWHLVMPKNCITKHEFRAIFPRIKKAFFYEPEKQGEIGKKWAEMGKNSKFLIFLWKIDIRRILLMCAVRL